MLEYTLEEPANQVHIHSLAEKEAHIAAGLTANVVLSPTVLSIPGAIQKLLACGNRCFFLQDNGVWIEETAQGRVALIGQRYQPRHPDGTLREVCRHLIRQLLQRCA